MPRWKLAVSCATNAAVGILATLLMLMLIQRWGEDALFLLKAGVLGVGLLYVLLPAVDVYLAYRAGRPNGLQPIEQALFSSNPVEQRIACLALSRLAGNRFGMASPASVALWKQWWTRHAATLSWRPEVGALVEAELDPDRPIPEQ